VLKNSKMSYLSIFGKRESEAGFKFRPAPTLGPSRLHIMKDEETHLPLASQLREVVSLDGSSTIIQTGLCIDSVMMVCFVLSAQIDKGFDD
jgi:hypothetical protein